ESIDDHHLGETEQYAKRREQLEEYLEKVTDDVTADLTTADTGFSVYDELKSKLIDMGIPEGEIKFIHDANSDQQKQDLFDLVNAGKVRILMGSSPKMGAGMNAQERLVALHHLDAPWRPSDVEQREGRIVRQGNKLYEADPKGFKVRLIAYSTKNTFDAVMWQILARKGSMLDDFRSGKRSCEDMATDSASYSDFMAETTGNPAYKEKHQLENEIRILEDRKRKTQVRLRSSKQTLEYNKDAREKTKDAISRREALIALLKGNETFTYKGVEYDGNINKIVEEERDRIREQNIKALEEYDQKIDVAREEAFKDLGTRAWVKPSVPRSFKSENPKEWEAYEEAKAEYAAFWENEENQKKFKAAIKGIKRPSQKSVDFDKLAKSHKNLAAVAEMAKDVNALDVGDTFSFKIGDAQIEIHKTESGWTDKKSTDAAQLYDYSITGNGVFLASVKAALSFSKKEMSYAVNTEHLVRKAEDLVSAGNTSLRNMDIADKNAQVTLDNLQFKDEEALQAKKARFEEVLEIVRVADEEIAARRAASSNKYIEKDRKRFGDEHDVMDDIIRKEAATKSEHYIVIGKNEFKPVDGKDVEVVDWLETFIWKSGKEWVVTEKTTGLRIFGAGTQKGAISGANERLAASGEEKTRKAIADAIENSGGTPYYRARTEQARVAEPTETLNHASLKSLLDQLAGKLKGIAVEEKDGTLQIRTR
ncbi:MAG TPA: helicase C-terminal domain-containing protein, partial [Syntrophales bacterium]|nr:helicase C-terminal domain-containing protein [Syntrophales bacterium]